MRYALAQLPIPISGVMLALLAMSNVMVLEKLPGLGIFLRGLGLCLFGLLVLKLVLAFPSVKAVWHHQAVVSTMATFPMALLIIATYLPAIGLPLWLARWFWLAVIMLEVGIIWLYTTIVWSDFSIEKMDPGWFTVYIGTAEIAITAPQFAPRLGQLVFWFCVIIYLGIGPGVLKRVLVLKDLPTPILPMTAILAAPFSICLVAYLKVFTLQPGLFWSLLVGCQFFYVLAIYKIIQILFYQRVPFYPSYAAFTFPLAISANAITLATRYLPRLTILADIENTVAIIMCGFVLVSYGYDFIVKRTKKA